MDHHVSVIIVAIVALGVAAQWLAWRTRLPAIVLLATAGLIVGVSGLKFIDPTDTFGNLLRPIVSLCVAIILFEGGLNLHLHELRHAAVGVKRLVYVGAPVGFLMYSIAGHYIGGLTWEVALVFGAILVVTGPTVIMPLLRQAGLNRRTASYLKWEGIVNDPIGALLAVLVFQFFIYVGEGSGWGTIITGLSLALASGIFLGGVGGWLTGQAFLRGWVPEYLKSPVMLTLVLVVFEASNYLQHEAGLLAVTVMGMVIGNMHIPGLQDMKRFKEYITIMLVSTVFILLTADIDLRIAKVIGWQGVALIFVVLFICRPLTIWLATMRSDMQKEDRILLAWIAPRGIVAAATAGIMGPRMFESGYTDAEALLPLIFFVIFATVVLHGLSIGWLSRRLGLSSSDGQNLLIVGASPWSIEFAKKVKTLGVEVLISDTSWHNLKPARLAGIQVFYGEILSEFAEATVEIAHVDAVLAASSNDAYNALVCTMLAPEIGHKKVYQLPLGAGAEEADKHGAVIAARGISAFKADAVFEKLWKQHIRGWVFYSTKLSENYTYSDYLGDASAEAMLLMVLKANGEIVLESAKDGLEPNAGDTILYYSPEKTSDKFTETGRFKIDAKDFEVGI